MTKEQLRKLALTDGIIISYSGKLKTAYFKSLSGLNAYFISKYRALFNDIGYNLIY